MTLRTESVVPASSADVFEVRRDQYLRIIAHEGPQVCDAVFVGADDHEETYCSDLTVLYNQLQGTGDMRRVKQLYSRPPDTKMMLTVTEDRIGHHFPWAGGMCSSFLYEIRGGDPEHANCADNLFEALTDYGLEIAKVPEVFNIGMNVTVEDNQVAYHPPEFERGDYIEFRAEMDLIAGLSACPNDTTDMNEYEPKSLKIQVYDEPPE